MQPLQNAIESYTETGDSDALREQFDLHADFLGGIASIQGVKGSAVTILVNECFSRFKKYVETFVVDQPLKSVLSELMIGVVNDHFNPEKADRGGQNHPQDPDMVPSKVGSGRSRPRRHKHQRYKVGDAEAFCLLCKVNHPVADFPKTSKGRPKSVCKARWKEWDSMYSIENSDATGEGATPPTLDAASIREVYDLGGSETAAPDLPEKKHSDIEECQRLLAEDPDRGLSEQFKRIRDAFATNPPVYIWVMEPEKDAPRTYSFIRTHPNQRYFIQTGALPSVYHKYIEEANISEKVYIDPSQPDGEVSYLRSNDSDVCYIYDSFSTNMVIDEQDFQLKCRYDYPNEFGKWSVELIPAGLRYTFEFNPVGNADPKVVTWLVFEMGSIMVEPLGFSGYTIKGNHLSPYGHEFELTIWGRPPAEYFEAIPGLLGIASFPRFTQKPGSHE